MLSALITISPFLALPYIITAVIQKVRGSNRIGFWTTLLAYVAVIVPLVALALDTVNALYEPLLPAAILANAVIVLVISAVILLLDYRKEERDLNQSYGLLGLGVAILLLVGVVTTPLILSLIPGSISTSTQAAGTTPAQTNAVTDTSLTNVLIEQTGLSLDEIQSQMTNGTSLAALIEAHSGSIEAVTGALAQAINQAIEAGTVPQQMLDRMGGNAAAVAAQIVNGELPAQIASRVLSTFTGEGAAPGGFGGNPPSGELPQGFDPANMPAPADMQSAANTDARTVPQTRPQNQAAASDQAASPVNVPASPTPAPTSTPTEIIAPVIVVQTEAPTAIPATMTATPEPATCSLVINFNLNLRAQPNSGGELITTIPFGSVVQTTGQNGDGWWQVSYGRQSGWVSGEFVTPGTGCAALPTAA